jgi:hypothetical protein
MKIRLVKLTPEQLIKQMQGMSSTLKFNLPNDTELLDIKLDLYNREVLAIVRSDSFDDVAETMPLPEFNPYAPPTVMVQPKKTLISQEAPNEKTSVKPQPALAASRMEEEFSPDQRKLLSFTVKDDCLVVKPIQFLKAEWADINDVVKSVGGRWVKGDIISYWEIPLQET